MKKFALVLIFVAFATLALIAHAENRQAQGCEIFVKAVQAQPNTHGSGAMAAVVKVNWLGNGEFIQKVGFYGHVQSTDLGNLPGQCFMSGHPADTAWEVQWPVDPTWYHGSKLEPGEYLFQFQTRTGSVVSVCPGFHFASIGTFFVETNRNTYWVNPDMDPAKFFYFDSNGFDSIQAKGGTNMGLPTSRDDLRYYNALGCQ